MLTAPQHIIAIDIDGTLYDDHDHYNIDRFNTDLIALNQANIQLVVATGNSYDAVQTIFSQSPAVQTFVAENGGRMVINGRTIIAHPHQRPTLQRLLRYVQSLVVQPDLMSLSGDQATHIAAKFQSVPVPFYPHHDYFHQLNEIDEDIYNLNVNWFKQRPSLDWMLMVANEINQQFTGLVNATYSGLFGIDILPAQVNKARGLNELIAHYPQVTMENVTAYGDSTNDSEMITAVGTGIAMKNATTDLKALANEVTQFDNNHDGLLFDIEQRFLN